MKFDVRYFAGNGFWLLVKRVVSSLSAFLLALAAAHVLSKDVYGIYKYLLASTGIIAAFSLTGMGASLTRSVARGFEGILKKAFYLKMRFGFITTIIAFGISIYYIVQGNNAFALVYGVFGLLFPFWDAALLYGDFLQGKTRFKELSKLTVVLQFCLTVILIGLMFLFPHSAVVLVIASFFVQCLFAFIYYKRIAKQAVQTSFQESDEVTGYAKHLSAINVLANISNQVENVLLFQILGPASLAIYAFATAIPEQIKGVLGNLGTLLFPRFAKRDIESVRASLKSKFLFLFLIGIAVVGSYIIIAPFIYQWFFPQYIEAVFYSQIFSISLLNMTFAPSAVALQAQKKIKEQYLSNTVIPVARIVSAIIFVYFLGILGIVISRVIVRIGGSLLDLYLLYRS